MFDGNYIITPRNGTIGLVFNVTGKIFPSDHVFVIKLKDDENTKYVYYYLSNCVDLDAKKHGSTIPNITKKDIEDSIIKLPCKNKQVQIVKYCDILSNSIDNIQQQIKNNKILMKQTINMYINENNNDIYSNNKNDDDDNIVNINENSDSDNNINMDTNYAN